MNFIDAKKINKYIVMAVLFLSFGFAEWQSSRGILAYVSYTYPQFGAPSWLFNDIVAIIIGGIIPFGLYELVTLFASRFVSARTGGATDSLKYALRFFMIAANMVIGAIKFIYYASFVAFVWGEVLIGFIVTTAAVALFIAYSLKHYIEPTRWGATVLSVGGTYLAVMAFVVAFNLITGVLL